MASINNFRNFGETWPKAASTAFAIGDFVIANGAGAVIPATGGTGGLLGITNEVIQSTDPDYATVRPINISSDIKSTEFTVPVTAGGPADATAIGQTIDVDAADASGVDFATLGTGTDLLVTGFINASTLIVKII